MARVLERAAQLESVQVWYMCNVECVFNFLVYFIYLYTGLFTHHALLACRTPTGRSHVNNRLSLTNAYLHPSLVTAFESWFRNYLECCWPWSNKYRNMLCLYSASWLTSKRRVSSLLYVCYTTVHFSDQPKVPLLVVHISELMWCQRYRRKLNSTNVHCWNGSSFSSLIPFKS